MTSQPLDEEVLVALRRIARAIDLHSRNLLRVNGLTGPQAVLLKELIKLGECTVSRLAQRVSLSQATVTDILNRLEQRTLVTRQRSQTDKRCVLISPTAKAVDLMKASPSLLQDAFIGKFRALHEWERHSLLASLQRVADMMDAKQEIDAVPILSGDPIDVDANRALPPAGQRPSPILDANPR